MRYYLLFLITIITANLCSAQDSLSMKSGFWEMNYYQGNVRIKRHEFVKTLQANPAAYQSYKKGQAASAVATVIGAIGGGLVGYELGTLAGGGDIHPAVMAAGGALVVISIPISISASNSYKKALNKYNSERYNSNDEEACNPRKTEYHIAFTGNGLGLVMKF